MRNNLVNIIRLGLSILLIVSLCKLGLFFYASYENETIYASINSQKDVTNNEIEDLIGWVEVPNTQIDYPVVQTVNNEFYLDHNVLKEESRYGAIFMDYRNLGFGLDQHTIVYGHHMRDGSMFKDLMKYKQVEFFRSNPIINTWSDVEEIEQIQWEVFSAYVVEDDFNYLVTDFQNQDEFALLIEELKQRSLYESDVEVDENDQILTLSTCSYESENARYVVHAKRVG